MATAQISELCFSERKVRNLVTSAIELARSTTPLNVSNAACVQWTMEDRFLDGRWRSTLQSDSDTSSNSPFFEEEALRTLVTDAVRLARRTTPGNVCDEACVQRIMKDRFIGGVWRSTLRAGATSVSA